MRGSGPQEIEVKFHVRNLRQVDDRLGPLGATQLGERNHEFNLRFDTPDRKLEAQGCALRLRRDAGCTLTYKGPSAVEDGIRSRTELEIEVGDYDQARLILEALGYVVTFTYEKYRSCYTLDEAVVALDELPYGDFVEIEGEASMIRSVAERLGLRWDRAVPDSYLGVFERLRRAQGLGFADLTFERFRQVPVQLEGISIAPADA